MNKLMGGYSNNKQKCEKHRHCAYARSLIIENEKIYNKSLHLTFFRYAPKCRRTQLASTKTINP